MKKIVCKKEYDTESATLVKKVIHGEVGSKDGYEESLYMMPDGSYFYYYNGGEASPYGTEDIKRIAKAKAEAWIQENA